MLTPKGQEQPAPDPNRDLATLSDLRAAIETLEASGITHFYELHLRHNSQGDYMFVLETPGTPPSHGRPSICSGTTLRGLDQPGRTKAFTDMGTRCAQAIDMMNNGAGL